MNCRVNISVLTSISAFLVSNRYRRDPLIHTLAGFTAAYLALLSLSPYSPPRYFLPLIVPLAGLCAMACVELQEWLGRMQWFNSNILALIPLILVFGLALSGTGKIVAYSANPIFSFSQMAHGVGRIIQAREGKIHDVVLFGNIADSVALEIGVRSVNTVLGIRSLNLKLKEYRPKYLLLHTDYKKVVEAVRSEGGHVTRLASWDVYGNYYGNGQKVQILSVRWN